MLLACNVIDKVRGLLRSLGVDATLNLQNSSQASPTGPWDSCFCTHGRKWGLLGTRIFAPDEAACADRQWLTLFGWFRRCKLPAARRPETRECGSPEQMLLRHGTTARVTKWPGWNRSPFPFLYCAQPGDNLILAQSTGHLSCHPSSPRQNATRRLGSLSRQR